MNAKIENLEFDALLEEFKKALAVSKLKYTKQREVLLRTLYNSNSHFTPEALHSAIRSAHPELNVGIATVYRTLNLLEESGMATSITFGAQGKKFELANKPHHDHLICKSCNKIIEFTDSAIEKKQIQIANDNGFILTGHIMQLYGICADCAKKRK